MCCAVRTWSPSDESEGGSEATVDTADTAGTAGTADAAATDAAPPDESPRAGEEEPAAQPEGRGEADGWVDVSADSDD